MTTETTQPPIDPTIAELLEDARDRKRLSRRRTVIALDTTELTYRNWARGAVTPGLEWTDAIAELCEVSRYVVLAAMGILTADEAAILDRELGLDIPG